MPFPKTSVRVPFSKSTVFKVCRQKMCRFRVNGRPIRRIFHRFQNVRASCERSLNHSMLSSIYLTTVIPSSLELAPSRISPRQNFTLTCPWGLIQGLFTESKNESFCLAIFLRFQTQVEAFLEFVFHKIFSSTAKLISYSTNVRKLELYRKTNCLLLSENFYERARNMQYNPFNQKIFTNM